MRVLIRTIVTVFILQCSVPGLYVTATNNYFAFVEYQNEKKKKSLFRKHFKILESTVKANPQDTIYRCCKSSIDFMVNNTNIESDAEIISSIGRTSFTKTDLKRWREWYDNNYGKKQ